MLKVKEKYTVEIESINNLGNGVARISGITVFVPYAITGDLCEIEIAKAYPTYAIGALISLLTPSQYRISPDCPHFGECGGCAHLNCSMDVENSFKEANVGGILKKFGIDAKTEKTVCPVSENYRNKVLLFYGNGGFGYYRQGTNATVPHTRCVMNPPVFDEIAEYCNKHLDKDGLRALFIRKSSHTEPKIMVSPIFSKRKDISKFSIGLINEFSGIEAVLYGVNKEKEFVFEKTEFHTVYGDGYIYDEICGLKFRISPKSFYQINHTCAELLYEKAIELAEANKDSRIADLFCGTGTMGMIIAKRTGAKVTGVEIEKSAVSDARHNAKINGIKSIEFFADDAKNFDKEADICIIDPPRKGCSKLMIDTLLRLKPNRIVYVSCNPDTMARDINLLSEQYEISSPVSVYNMFPRTSHVESVVRLTKIKSI